MKYILTFEVPAFAGQIPIEAASVDEAAVVFREYDFPTLIGETGEGPAMCDVKITEARKYRED